MAQFRICFNQIHHASTELKVLTRRQIIGYLRVKECQESCGIILGIRHTDPISVTIVQALQVVLHLLPYAIFNQCINDAQIENGIATQDTTFELLMERQTCCSFAVVLLLECI